MRAWGGRTAQRYTLRVRRGASLRLHRHGQDSDRCLEPFAHHHLDALLVIGGDGTMSVAAHFARLGVNCIGVPKTIDNDLAGTDVTFGFATALAIAADALDRIHTTAASHHRAMVVEVMGRNAGWIALHAGLASGADVILLPEAPSDIALICDFIAQRARRGKRFAILCVSEGARPVGGAQVVARIDPTSPDPIRLGGIGELVAREIETRTGMETRTTVLGHVQRGRTSPLRVSAVTMDEVSSRSPRMDWRNHPWAGVFPATLCPFHEDESIDEAGLREYIAELAGVEGVKGVTCNGHTGEIMSLRPAERAQVTRIVAEAVRAAAAPGRRIRTISGVSAEGSLEAIDHALAAKEAGADAILLMPPHHWLRFGRTGDTAVGFFEDVAEAGIPIVVHQYPAWTKASYSLKEMLELVKIPQVVCIKMGTRDMARWRYDYEKLKEAAPNVPVITCHDEYLLASLLEGADGALVGFAGFVPELIVEVVHKALDGDLDGAREARKLVDPLARIVYSFGEPSSDAHQRMKCARWLMGRFPSSKMRRPLRDLPAVEVEKIRRGLDAIGYLTETAGAATRA